MANVTMTTQALGNDHAACCGCDQPFGRAETRYSVAFYDDNIAGHVCGQCIADWVRGRSMGLAKPSAAKVKKRRER